MKLFSSRWRCLRVLQRFAPFFSFNSSTLLPLLFYSRGPPARVMIVQLGRFYAFANGVLRATNDLREFKVGAHALAHFWREIAIPACCSNVVIPLIMARKPLCCGDFFSARALFLDDQPDLRARIRTYTHTFDYGLHARRIAV